jgi:hypothetical protein
MTLRAAYGQYLRAGATRDAASVLARALRDSMPEDSELLARYASDGAGWCIHGGVRVFIGSAPPESELGARWFDCCDLSSNVLLSPYLPEDERESLSEEAVASLATDLTWFSLRPVSRFQFLAFLDVALIERISQNALDPARFTAQVETAPVTSLLCDEAGLYLSWFGKSFPGRLNWYSAREVLGYLPWENGVREWLGESRRTSGYDSICSRELLDGDIDADEISVLESEAPEDVTFRSVVRMMWGLTSISVPVQIGPARACVRASFPRHG